MRTNFPQRMQVQRERMGYSVQELGNQIGVAWTYIEQIEAGLYIPKPEVARRIAEALSDDEQAYLSWAAERETKHRTMHEHPLQPAPRYPEAREALITLCDDPELARRLFWSSAIGPLEAAIYGLLIERMSQQMGDLGFWGFLSPRSEQSSTPNARLLLDAFFEMLSHPEGEIADYTKVFSTLVQSWRYGPGPHRISVVDAEGGTHHYRLAMVDQDGSIIPALEPEDPFYALYRMLSAEERSDIAEVCRVMLRRDKRIEIQAALAALSRWHDINKK